MPEESPKSPYPNTYTPNNHHFPQRSIDEKIAALEQHFVGLIAGLHERLAQLESQLKR
jgi:hypothetical protein